MSSETLATKLQDLICSSEERSETARLRDVIVYVEAALAAGISRSKIIELLQEEGFKMGLASFQSALYRIRKEAARQQVTAPALAPQLSEQGASVSPETDDLSGLSLKARGQLVADRFLQPKITNPLVRKLVEEQQKKKT